jgi:hypothetical protein
MSKVTANTRVMRTNGELFISVQTLEQLATNMILDNPQDWAEEIRTLKGIIKNAHVAAEHLHI